MADHLTPNDTPDGCAWCGKPGVTKLYLGKGKRRRGVNVCEDHATRFEAQGDMTERKEAQGIAQKSEESRRPSWQKGWRKK